MSDYEIKYKLDDIKSNANQIKNKADHISNNQDHIKNLLGQINNNIGEFNNKLHDINMKSMDSNFYFNIIVAVTFLIFWFLFIEHISETKALKKCEADKISENIHKK
jgi:hypothetical protein